MFKLQCESLTPSGLAFTRNPVVLRLDGNPAGQPVAGTPFYISRGNTELYKGRFTRPFFCNIAEVLEAAVPNLPDASSPDCERIGPLIVLEDEQTFRSRQVTVFIPDDSSDIEMAVIPLRGGIPASEFRSLPDGHDIFSKRFLGDASNFFMTGRSRSSRIVIRETELFPLCFLIDNPGTELRITENVGGNSYSLGKFDCAGAYALDFDTLRRWFFDNHSVLASSFRVFRNGRAVCTVVIEQVDAVRERHRLKYRNSFGVFELLDLAGAAEFSPQWKEASDYETYIEQSDSTATERARLSAGAKITLTTEAHTVDALRMIFDMLASEEVYLIEQTDSPLRVIPRPGEKSWPLRSESPQSVSVDLTVAESDSAMVRVVDLNNRGGVFSRQFSKQFN